MKHLFRAFALAAALLSGVVFAPASHAAELKDLEGVWEARMAFGPQLRGPVVVERTAAGWRADLKGRTVAGVEQAGRLVFDFGDGNLLKVDRRSRGLTGFWVQGRGVVNGYGFMTPVAFQAETAGRWSGEVKPLDDTITLFMPVTIGADGKASTWWRNPELNAGRMLAISRISLDGETVRVHGKPFGAPEEQVVGEGRFDPDNDTLSIYVARVGQAYEFHRASGDSDL